MLDIKTIARIWLPLVTGLVAVCAVFHLARPPHTPVQWLGVVLSVLGLAGATISRWTLGSSFSITPQARRLVTRGIYSRVRNPIYISGNIFIAGLILIVGRP
jgi:protein-S-isoprenylcysteine O-methyltransferase Ste14